MSEDHGARRELWKQRETLLGEQAATAKQYRGAGIVLEIPSFARAEQLVCISERIRDSFDRSRDRMFLPTEKSQRDPSYGFVGWLLFSIQPATLIN